MEPMPFYVKNHKHKKKKIHALKPEIWHVSLLTSLKKWSNWFCHKATTNYKNLL